MCGLMAFTPTLKTLWKCSVIEPQHLGCAHIGQCQEHSLSGVEYDEEVPCPRQYGINKSKESEYPCESCDTITATSLRLENHKNQSQTGVSIPYSSETYVAATG